MSKKGTSTLKSTPNTQPLKSMGCLPIPWWTYILGALNRNGATFATHKGFWVTAVIFSKRVVP